jgi:ring-1,2-phenylacetyl-CoA epoxidase subunit PaaC
MSTTIKSQDLREYVLRLGDDALVAAQRLGEWSARAPEMEIDVALTNIALDQLGAARLLLSLVGDEDELAYLRTDRQFRNCLLVELPNGAADGQLDFAVTMIKLLFLSAYQRLVYDWLVGSADDGLAGIAAKTRKESAYHVDFASLWTVRLGDGTDESHARMQAAVDEVWPYTHELFEDDALARGLDETGIAVNPATLHAAWLEQVEAVLAEATLTRPADRWQPTGGRAGVHTEHLSYLLAEMQVLHRAHPGATW